MQAPTSNQRKPIKDLTKVFHYTDTMTRMPTRDNDPYEYMAGFGNRFQSEVIPGILPAGQNNPQEPRFGLYTEGLTYSAFTAPRHANFSTYTYRVRPAAAHMTTLAGQAEWAPFPLPNDDEKIDFIDGLHTLGGSGDPNLREGIALYVFMINADMDHRAYCNTDGDFLIVPQLGTLDIQTEMGLLVPATRRTNPRDFLHPVAHIDENLHEDWEIVNKANGRYSVIGQDHSPFDLVAWHGNVVPYKYDLTKFASQNATSIDHTDPSVNCVLTAPSRDPVTPLADFLWFGPRWDVASNTFRPPYFHRNSATEFLACLYGNGLGRSEEFLPGGGSVEVSHTPHGNFSDGYIADGIDQMTIMVESSRSFLFTEYARSGCGTFKNQGPDPELWDALPDKFSAYPNIKKIHSQVKSDEEAWKKQLEAYYDDDWLAERYMDHNKA
ncbi:homogentisate 1,2-dioxygenase [Aspergillus costaricaensis CBS 115574]|uniref:Homogentisate 1,2-dioxygenase n=1 Tax=Aspergillus costaricaensis CBS 115574 TaxID=1448317 RepID=A0ACD1ITA8_9EURO|nr:homogentisate 1,2-dioxygenase [Aspergillus costaricaensis CBS 115574]RAK93934.1 homogentisate 1,2-dioxygenase [Aspergillus costaricaensis CBS 115574]